MKKLNKKGFTLIELLAVIVIMGILMFVAVPAVSRMIENSRKDTFIDTAKAYANQVATLWAADGLQCGSDAGDLTSTSLPKGVYYVPIDTANTGSNTTIYQKPGATIETKSVSVPTLLDQGGKSSWSNKDVKGFVAVRVYEVSGVTGLKTAFYVTIVDGVHGLSHSHVTEPTAAAVGAGAKAADKLVRGDVALTSMDYKTIFGDATATNLDINIEKYSCKEV